MSGTRNGQQMGLRVETTNLDAPDLEDQEGMSRALDRWLDRRGLKKTQKELRDESFARMRARKMATDRARPAAAPVKERRTISIPKLPTKIMKENLDAAQIGPRLKDARIAAGWDGRGVVKMFRAAAPLDSATMCHAELGKTVSERTIARYCKTLNLRREWVMTGEGEMWQAGGPASPPGVEPEKPKPRATVKPDKAKATRPAPSAPLATTAGPLPAMLREHRDRMIGEIVRLQDAVRAADALLATL